MPKACARQQKHRQNIFAVGNRTYKASFNLGNENYAVRREGQQAIIGWVARDRRIWRIEGKRTPFMSMGEAVTALVRGA